MSDTQIQFFASQWEANKIILCPEIIKHLFSPIVYELLTVHLHEFCLSVSVISLAFTSLNEIFSHVESGNYQKLLSSQYSILHELHNCTVNLIQINFR